MIKKNDNMIQITKKVCSAETHVKTSQRNKNIHFKNVNACEVFQDDVEWGQNTKHFSLEEFLEISLTLAAS